MGNKSTLATGKETCNANKKYPKGTLFLRQIWGTPNSDKDYRPYCFKLSQEIS